MRNWGRRLGKIAERSSATLSLTARYSCRADFSGPECAGCGTDRPTSGLPARSAESGKLLVRRTRSSPGSSVQGGTVAV